MNESILNSVIVGAAFAFAVAVVTYLNNPAAVVTVCVIGTVTALTIAARD